eukprot:1139430-Pelagomonas_calceolata.AAC.7
MFDNPVYHGAPIWDKVCWGAGSDSKSIGKARDYGCMDNVNSVRFYNALLRSNSTTLSKVLRANVGMSSLSRNCWTSEVLAACTGLDSLRGVWNTNALARCDQGGLRILGDRLRAQTLKVETAAWDPWSALLCDRCSCDEVQDEAHALLVCRDANFCALRRKHAYLFNCFLDDFSMEQPYLQQASAQAIYDFLLQHNNKLF